MLDHPVGFQSKPGLALGFRLEVCEDVHSRRVEPAKERPAGLVLAVHEIQRSGQKFLIHRFHALLRQRAGIFDPAIGIGMKHAARPEVLFELGVLRVVGVLRFFFGVEVVEITEKLVEAVVGGKKLVLIAQVVLAELSGRITKRLEEFGNSRIFRPNSPTASARVFGHAIELIASSFSFQKDPPQKNPQEK